LQLYFGDTDGNLFRANLDGTGVSLLLQGLGAVIDSVVDAHAGKLYFTGPGVFRANLDGSHLELLASFHYAGLALDPLSQSLFLTADNEGRIDRLDLRSHTLTTILQFPVEPLSNWLPDVAVDVVNRKLYWIHSSLTHPAIQMSNLDGSHLQDVVVADPEPIGGIFGRYLAIDAANRKLYWSSPTSPLEPGNFNGGIFRANLDGSNPEQVIDLGANDVMAIDFGPTTPISFAAFTATLKIALAPRIDDAFDLKSRFTLGTGSNGIDLLAEAMTLTITGGTGAFTVLIPAGSFTKDKLGRFTFEGTIADVKLEAKIIPLRGNHYEFKAEGKHTNLTGIAYPAIVTLTIGDDSGTTKVQFVD
jgi:hypothetical protein